jgi:rubrerythrin
LYVISAKDLPCERLLSAQGESKQLNSIAMPADQPTLYMDNRMHRENRRGGNMRIVGSLSLVIALTLTAASSPQVEHSKLNPQTRENLMTAMKGEAFAYAKYMAYAEHARQSGHTNIADLFERTAKMEHLEHFRELAEIAQLAGSDTDNLRDAIQGETHEYQTMYPQFADHAATAGDIAAAERFREISRDEMEHSKMFRAALSGLEQK